MIMYLLPILVMLMKFILIILIVDLTGIEDFVALELNLRKVINIQSVDLSSNTLLYRIKLSSNNLTSIDVNSHTN